VYTLYKLHKSHHSWNSLKPSGQHRKDWPLG
jgi:sterol desaturase/sphingolipid hydroxylase (fatty acid hydroxylase superfamily)